MQKLSQIAVSTPYQAAQSELAMNVRSDLTQELTDQDEHFCWVIFVSISQASGCKGRLFIEEVQSFTFH